MQRRELFSFLSSSIKGEKREKAIQIIRPPYFNDISAFDKECINCDGLCATSCQEHIIIIAEDNNSDEVAKFVENIKIDNFYLTTGKILAHYNNVAQTKETKKLINKQNEDIVLESKKNEKFFKNQCII